MEYEANKKNVIAYDFSEKFVEFVYNKLNLSTWENIYKYFSEKNMPNILIKTMYLLKTKIRLTQARQIITMDFDYNTCLNNHVEKRISQIW